MAILLLPLLGWGHCKLGRLSLQIAGVFRHMAIAKACFDKFSALTESTDKRRLGQPPQEQHRRQ
eukprot:5834639-Amphidinium_carterae.1